MAQHINLMHAGLVRRSEPFNSSHGGMAIVAAVAVVALATFALQLKARQQADQASAQERDTLALQTRFAAFSGTAPESEFSAELLRLRRLETSQRQMRNAIASGSAGGTQGYAAHFTALARQAQPTLWITGFSIAADGVALELQGRMGDPRLLPGYLRRLNTEPLFKGREFAQLSLKAVESSAAATGGYTEFALRGVPAAAEPAR